jgi:hypothetical protein
MDEVVTSRSAPLEHKQGRLFEFSHIMEQEAKAALGWNGSVSYVSAYHSGGVWFEELKFNKHCSTFVLFDKKFPILD